jgi:hypothetical protein
MFPPDEIMGDEIYDLGEFPRKKLPLFGHSWGNLFTRSLCMKL